MKLFLPIYIAFATYVLPNHGYSSVQPRINPEAAFTIPIADTVAQRAEKSGHQPAPGDAEKRSERQKSRRENRIQHTPFTTPPFHESSLPPRIVPAATPAHPSRLFCR